MTSNGDLVRRSLLIAGLLFGLPLFAQQPRLSNREEYGFHGPVHTVRTQVDVTRGSRSHICGKCVFDVRGDFVFRQSTDESGKNANGVASYERDELGWPTKLVSRDGEGKVVALTKFRNGPFGPLETDEWVRGKLVDKEINTYDDRGNQLTSDTYDESGNLIMGDAWRYDEHGNDIERRTRWATGECREESRYDDSGKLLEVVRYDTGGNVVMRGTFGDSEVTSWWMKPHANVSMGFVMSDTGGKHVEYSTRDDGRLNKSVSFHLGR